MATAAAPSRPMNCGLSLVRTTPWVTKRIVFGFRHAWIRSKMYSFATMLPPSTTVSGSVTRTIFMMRLAMPSVALVTRTEHSGSSALLRFTTSSTETRFSPSGGKVSRVSYRSRRNRAQRSKPLPEAMVSTQSVRPQTQGMPTLTPTRIWPASPALKWLPRICRPPTTVPTAIPVPTLI